MTDSTTQVLDAALQLEPDQRAELVSALIQSLDDAPPNPDAEKAWTEEIRRRLKTIEDGSAEFVDWETLRQRVWAKRQK